MTRSTTTLPWLGCQSIPRLPPPPPPAFHRASLTIHRWLFKLLGGERHRGSKASCPRTQRNDPARSRTQTSRPRVHCTDYRVTTSLIAYMHMRSSRLLVFPQMKKRLGRSTVNEDLLAGSRAPGLAGAYPWRRLLCHYQRNFSAVLT